MTPENLLPAALPLAAGIVLLVSGRRTMRAGFAVGGLAVGAFAGWLVAPMLPGGVSPLVPTVVLGLVAACIAALLFRMAVAGALGLVGLVAAPLVLVAIDHAQHGLPAPPLAMPERAEPAADDPASFFLEPPPTLPPEAAPSDAADDTADAGGLGLPDSADELAAAATRGISEARELAERIAQSLRDWWLQVPEARRPALAGAAIGGLVLGLLAGTVLADTAALVASSLAGALLVLAGARVLVEAAQFELPPALAGPSGWWAVLWAALSVVGAAVQWTTRRRTADKSG